MQVQFFVCVCFWLIALCGPVGWNQYKIKGGLSENSIFFDFLKLSF